MAEGGANGEPSVTASADATPSKPQSDPSMSPLRKALSGIGQASLDAINTGVGAVVYTADTTVKATGEALASTGRAIAPVVAEIDGSAKRKRTQSDAATRLQKVHRGNKARASTAKMATKASRVRARVEGCPRDAQATIPDYCARHAYVRTL